MYWRSTKRKINVPSLFRKKKDVNPLNIGGRISFYLILISKYHNDTGKFDKIYLNYTLYNKLNILFEKYWWYVNVIFGFFEENRSLEL